MTDYDIKNKVAAAEFENAKGMATPPKNRRPALIAAGILVLGLMAGYFLFFGAAEEPMPMPAVTAESAVDPALETETAEAAPETPAEADALMELPAEDAMAEAAPSMPGGGEAPVVSATEASEVVDPTEEVVGAAEQVTETSESGASAETEAVAPVAEAIVAEAPSPAELAIVENSAVLDQLSQAPPQPPAAAADPAAMKSANEILAQDAIVRPLPKQYLVVKKNHDAGDIDSRLTAARQALAQNRDAAALQLFEDLYVDYPLDKRVLMGRAVALQKLGQSPAALEAYEDVLRNNPQNLEALTNMLGLIKVQNPSLAVEKLKELRETYPYSADITAQLGVAYAGIGSYDDASRYLDMAEALQPGSVYILYNKAVLYDRMGKTDQAGSLYRQIVRMAAEGKVDAALPIESIKRRLSTMR